MKHALSLVALLVTPILAEAALLDDLTAGNIGATNLTVSFQSTSDTGGAIPTTALLEWGKGSDLGNKTTEQHASDHKPPSTSQPVSGLRCIYVDDLTPGQTYQWKLTVTSDKGESAEQTGSFTTLEVNTGQKRGPDGTHKPPHTPAYETPAAYQASTWAAVNEHLKSCRGGEVIELTTENTGDAPTAVLTGGNEAWEQNVLIRPALGKRGSNQAGVIEINSPHVTVAGFNLDSAFMYPKYGTHPGNQSGVGAKRAFFWMCTVARGGTLLGNGSPDSGWYEVVALKRGVGGDRAQIKTFGDIVPDNFTIAGCWLEGKDRTNKTDHSDTLQTLSPQQTIRGLKLIDSVFFRSANCSGQLTHLQGTQILNCWFGPLVVKSKVCGSFYSTLGACDGAVFRDSEWNGSFRQDANPAEIVNCSFTNLKQPGVVSENNKVGEDLRPQPPLPDLAKIWPR